MRVGRVLLLMLVALLVAGIASASIGCRPKVPAPSTSAQTPTTTPTPTSTPPASVETPTTPPQTRREVPIRAYFVRGEVLTVVGRTSPSSAVAAEAMKALLEGPTAAEKADGVSTQIPTGTKLLGVSIANGTATVDLSKHFESGGGSLSMTLRIAQVVTTLTQFRLSSASRSASTARPWTPSAAKVSLSRRRSTEKTTSPSCPRYWPRRRFRARRSLGRCRWPVARTCSRRSSA